MAEIDFTQVPYVPIYRSDRQMVYRLVNNRGISVARLDPAAGPPVYDVLTIRFTRVGNHYWDNDPEVPGTFYANKVADIVDYLGWLGTTTLFVSTVPEIMRPKR